MFFFDVEPEVMPLVYVAKISGDGTNPPIATVIENTIGGTPVWTRNGPGSYVLTIAGAFISDKTFMTSSEGVGSARILNHVHTDTDSVTFNGIFTDSDMVNYFVKVEVWQ